MSRPRRTWSRRWKVAGLTVLVVACAVPVWISVAETRSQIEVLPPLPTEPTVAELARHVDWYCTQLELCVPGRAESVRCAASMLEGTERPERRRRMAAMMNTFSSCMALDCASMPSCIRDKGAEKMEEMQAEANCGMPPCSRP